MTYRALIAAAATGVAALLGCADAPLAQTKSGSTDFKKLAQAFEKEYASVLCSGACPIRITVLENCNFRVVPWTVGVPRGSHNVPIQWHIDSASVGNAQFAASRGIFFKNAASAREFDGERRVSDTQYVWNDRNPTLSPKGRPHPYGINVVQNGKPCPTFDPTVVNDY